MRTQFEMWHSFFKFDPSLKSGSSYAIQYRIYWRRILSESQNHRCCWCGCETHLDEPKDAKYATIEHVVPKSDGGFDHPDNYAMSCKACNNTRRSKPIEIFMEELRNIKKGENVVKEKTSYTKTIKSGTIYYRMKIPISG